MKWILHSNLVINTGKTPKSISIWLLTSHRVKSFPTQWMYNLIFFLLQILSLTFSSLVNSLSPSFSITFHYPFLFIHSLLQFQDVWSSACPCVWHLQRVCVGGWGGGRPLGGWHSHRSFLLFDGCCSWGARHTTLPLWSQSCPRFPHLMIIMITMVTMAARFGETSTMCQALC